MNNFLIEMRRALRDPTSPRFSLLYNLVEYFQLPFFFFFLRDLSSQIHIMFSVSYYFKGNFDGVHFNKAPLPTE